MGAGASVSRQQWENADSSNEQQSKDDSPVTDMAGMAKLMEAKNKFMKNKKKNTACFQKEVMCVKIKVICPIWTAYGNYNKSVRGL